MSRNDGHPWMITSHYTRWDSRYTDHFCVCKNKIDKMLYKQLQKQWNNEDTCLHISIICPNLDRLKTNILLCLTWPKLWKTFAAISVHCNRLGHYRSCQNICIEKLYFHFLHICKCASFEELIPIYDDNYTNIYYKIWARRDVLISFYFILWRLSGEAFNRLSIKIILQTDDV